MPQRVKLKSISDSIPGTGVFGPGGEYKVGTVLTLPDDQPFIGSGYERHELLDGEKTDDHVAVTNPAEPTDEKPVVSAYTASATDSPGWWKITDADGNEVGKKVRPADGEHFNTLDDDAKAKFIADQG